MSDKPRERHCPVEQGDYECDWHRAHDTLAAENAELREEVAELDAMEQETLKRKAKRLTADRDALRVRLETIRQLEMIFPACVGDPKSLRRWFDDLCAVLSPEETA